MKKIMILVMVLALSACATGTETSSVNSQFDSQGNIQRTVSAVPIKDYLDREIAESKTECQKKYYDQTGHLTDAKDIALVMAMQSLNPRDPCPTVTTNNEVAINKTNQGHKTTRQAFGFLTGLVGIWGVTEISNKDPVVVHQAEPVVVQQAPPVVVPTEVVVVPGG